MDEFVHKADKLLVSKRISVELVNAMADTLNIIWADILHLLQDRRHILQLSTQFQETMQQCQERMNHLEKACTDAAVPIDITTIQDSLSHFKQLRIEMLTGMMAALKDGNELLALLQEVENMETLDTRPEHIKRDATRSIHQVQQWLELLHDRRNSLEIAWQTRKIQLEQCLALAILRQELNDIEKDLEEQRKRLTTFTLGECEQTANAQLDNYRSLKQQAIQLRDRALKITRAKEKFQSAGTFSGDEACTHAYSVLSSCTDFLDVIDLRENWLQQAIGFFVKSTQAQDVLDKCEKELTNESKYMSTTSPEYYALFSRISKDIKTLIDESLCMGYGLLNETSRNQIETKGIKTQLDKLEQRSMYFDCAFSDINAEHIKIQKALDDYLNQYDELLVWLKSSGQYHLQHNISLGTSLEESKNFLLQHHELMQDLEVN